MKTIYIDTTLHGFEVDIFKECRHLKANNEKGSQSSLKMGNVNIQITYEV